MTCGKARGVRVKGVTGDSWAVPSRQWFIESGSVEWGGVRVKGMTSGACHWSASQEDVPRGPHLAEVSCGKRPLRNGVG